MSVAVFTATVNATFKLYNNFMRAISIFTYLREHSYYISDFLWITQYEPSIEKQEGLNVDEYDSLEIKDITFKYPSSNVNSIDHLSMTLNKYDKIAIVGDNGGGKTTLTKLLLRFYNPETGQILLNGRDIRDYKLINMK